MMKGLEVRLISSTNEIISLLTDSTVKGSILDLEVQEVANGGVSSFSFNLSREIDIPITRNVQVLLLLDGVRWFRGFIDSIPEPDQNEPVLNIQGLGLSDLLSKVNVNIVYTSQTFDTIIKDLMSTYLSDIDVSYNADKIAGPALTGITIEFNDTDLSDCVDWLLNLANYDYNNNKYRWWIDTDGEFNFSAYGQDPEKTVFEGFQYQSPEVTNESDDLVNSILCYRANAEDSDVIEFVAEVQDTASIAVNGLYEEKLTFPSYTDTVTVENIARAKIARSANTTKTISVSLNVREKLAIGLYRVSNRRKTYWVNVDSCDSLDGWNTSTLSNGTLSLSSDHVLTGRQSLKIDFNTSTQGYIEKILSTPIPLPTILRVWSYIGSVASEVIVRFLDTTNSFVDIEISDTLLSQWAKYDRELPISYIEDTVTVSYDEEDDFDLDVNIDESTVDQLEIRTESDPSIRDVQKVQIHIVLPTGEGSIYMDLLQVFANVYKTSTLLLESINYELSATQKTAVANFGNKPPSLVDEINASVKDGDIALSVFSKS